MNIVISGPFGMGSLADEAVLAGLLEHLRSPKNTTTVLTHDAEKTARIHKVPAVVLQSPNSFLTNMDVWRALEKAHLFVLASAGAISTSGKQPARSWLAQLEHAQRAGAKTAVAGIGALPVSDARERARIQRFLQLNTDAISTRDSESKEAVISYGMNSNRVSFNGDPALAVPAPAAPATPGRAIGLVLAQDVPSCDKFGYEADEINQTVEASLLALAESLLKDSAVSVKIFHDDVDSHRESAESLREISADRIALYACDRPMTEIISEMSGCGALFSISLHGLILGAAAGVPVAGLHEETGAAEFLDALGLKDFSLSAPGGKLDANTAAAALKTQLARNTDLREVLQKRLAILKKKEAQNARMLTLLVPRRVAYERENELGGRPMPKKKHRDTANNRTRERIRDF